MMAAKQWRRLQHNMQQMWPRNGAVNVDIARGELTHGRHDQAGAAAKRVSGANPQEAPQHHLAVPVHPAVVRRHVDDPEQQSRMRTCQLPREGAPTQSPRPRQGDLGASEPAPAHAHDMKLPWGSNAAPVCVDCNRHSAVRCSTDDVGREVRPGDAIQPLVEWQVCFPDG